MNFVDFRISGQDIDFKRVSKTLNIIPKQICKKGNTNYDKFTKKLFTYSEDCWITGIEIENEDEIENQVSAFIDLLYTNKVFIQQLSDIHDITLWITINKDTFQYNLHFSKKLLHKISELKISMDITCIQL